MSYLDPKNDKIHITNIYNLSKGHENWKARKLNYIFNNLNLIWEKNMWLMQNFRDLLNKK